MASTTPWRKQPYLDVYRNHHGLVSHKWTQFPFIYDLILQARIEAGRPLTLLEIGVQNGGSLEIWKKYLPPGSEIHGMDINLACLTLKFSDGIQFHLGSATDLEFVNAIFRDTRFDVVLDDGSHMQGDIVSTFLNLFKKLKPGGVYIVEDLQTSYWLEYGGALGRHDSAIEFFKRMVDGINGDYSTGQAPKAGTDAIPFLSLYREEVASIAFYDSVCAITRYHAPKRERFAMVAAGENANVASLPPEQTVENRAPQLAVAQAVFTGEDAPSDPVSEFERLLGRGIEAVHRDCLEQAAAIFSELLYRYPQDPLPPAWMAIVCAGFGLADGAQDFISQAQTLAPERADLKAALGETFLKAGNPELGAQYLRDALANQPDLWAAYPALAQSLFETGNDDEAIAVLESAVAAIPPAQAAIRQTLVEMLPGNGEIESPQ
ncbi:MAG: tetratricopeptide repeat protein [Azoarcus sp.]|nr:tetratricopeptide repeat protein [Azoarcus sp.]